MNGATFDDVGYCDVGRSDPAPNRPAARRRRPPEPTPPPGPPVTAGTLPGCPRTRAAGHLAAAAHAIHRTASTHHVRDVHLQRIFGYDARANAKNL